VALYTRTKSLSSVSFLLKPNKERRRREIKRRRKQRREKKAQQTFNTEKMTTDRKCVLSRHRLVFDTSRARPSFLPLAATLCLFCFLLL